MSDQDEIAEFIAGHGVTKCPTAYVTRTLQTDYRAPDLAERGPQKRRGWSWPNVRGKRSGEPA